MNRRKLSALIGGGLLVACIVFVVFLFLVKVLWAWTIPDLFPGAADQGLVAREISWMTAVKLSLFVAVLSGLLGKHEVRKPKD